MSKHRLNVLLEGEHARHLAELAAVRRVPKSKLIALALAEFLAPDNAERRESMTARRIDKVSRELDRLHQDQTILIETLGLFIRQFLAATPAIPESQQEAARAQGRARFEQFFEQLARHLQRGTSLVARLSQAMEAHENEAAQMQPGGLHE